MTTTRLATSGDAATVARMLHDFNTEFDSPTPEVEPLTHRCRELIEAEEMTVVLGGDEPLGLAVLRFWPAWWSDGLLAYLEELYVVPDRRGEGVGAAIMATAMEVSRRRDAVGMSINVDEPDTGARRFYERLGFRNHDSEDPSARMFYYEREL